MTQRVTGVRDRAKPLRRPSEPALVLALALVSCTAGPLPRLPQVEQATEAVQGGGERYRAHRACSGQTSSVDDLVGCMRDAGWDFVTRGPGYPEADCWQARDRGELDRISGQCFVRSPEARRKLTP